MQVVCVRALLRRRKVMSRGWFFSFEANGVKILSLHKSKSLSSKICFSGERKAQSMFCRLHSNVGCCYSEAYVHKDEVSSGFSGGEREAFFMWPPIVDGERSIFSPTTTSFPQYSTIFLHTYCFTIYMCGAHKWIYFLWVGALVELLSFSLCGCYVCIFIHNIFITSSHLKNPSVFIGTHNGYAGFP